MKSENKQEKKLNDAEYAADVTDIGSDGKGRFERCPPFILKMNCSFDACRESEIGCT